jgi:hypothetical protein
VEVPDAVQKVMFCRARMSKVSGTTHMRKKLVGHLQSAHKKVVEGLKAWCEWRRIELFLAETATATTHTRAHGTIPNHDDLVRRASRIKAVLPRGGVTEAVISAALKHKFPWGEVHARDVDESVAEHLITEMREAKLRGRRACEDVAECEKGFRWAVAYCQRCVELLADHLSALQVVDSVLVNAIEALAEGAERARLRAKLGAIRGSAVYITEQKESDAELLSRFQGVRKELQENETAHLKADVSRCSVGIRDFKYGGSLLVGDARPPNAGGTEPELGREPRATGFGGDGTEGLDGVGLADDAEDMILDE